ERHTLHHQARDERHVAGKPVQLCDDHGLLRLPGLRQCRVELRPALQCIAAFARLHFNKLPSEQEAFGITEARNGFTLGLDTQSGLTLLACADTDIPNQTGHSRPPALDGQILYERMEQRAAAISHLLKSSRAISPLSEYFSRR